LKKNGTTRTTVRGDFGEVDIETLAIATAASNHRSWQAPNLGWQFSEAVISLYARGLTTRED
jgi:hypothetical protein